MNPHGATVSDRPPKVARVLAPERGLTSGRYRTPRPRNKNRHHRPPKRHLPHWAVPKVLVTALVSVATASTVVVVAFGGGNDPVAEVTTTSSIVVDTTITTEPSATTTTIASPSFWQTVAGAWTGTQVITKAYTASYGFVTPKVDTTFQFLLVVAGDCLTSRCMMTMSDPTSTDPPFDVYALFGAGDSIRINTTFALPCATDPTITDTGTYDMSLSVVNRAADGHATRIMGDGVLHQQTFDCSALGTDPVDWYLTWVFTRP